jgi:hypothetical protein
MVVRYCEVDRSHGIQVGDKIEQGQEIAKVGLLTPHVMQPAGEKRGMLHIEMYTGEGSGTFYPGVVPYSNMLYAKSGKYIPGASFQRRADLIDPLELLTKMYNESKNNGWIKK